MKFGEKASNLPFFLTFNGFTLRYSAIVLNSTVSSQTVYLCHADRQDNPRCTFSSFHFLKVTKRHQDIALSKKLEVLEKVVAKAVFPKLCAVEDLEMCRGVFLKFLKFVQAVRMLQE